jgi:predicted amidophosphoribosyltransferase
MSIHLETQDQTPQKGFALLKAGDPCPQCQAAIIDYDSMLNLSCPDCGYALAGCFT